MPVLTRRSTPVVRARQLTRRSVRSERRAFLVEGPQAVREALKVAGCVRELFVTSAALERQPELAAVAESAALALHLGDDDAVGSLCGSVTSQGIVAVCGFVDRSLADAIHPGARLVAMVANLRDPGNAGTIIRTADAAGADAVVLAGSSVDLYNDKVGRASAGSIFHLPIVADAPVRDAVLALRGAGFEVLATEAAAEKTLDGLLDSGALQQRVAWVFGNEAWGLEAADRALCDGTVAIPIYGRAESLNVAAAAAVCLYSTARAQRTG